ncbi:MFS general substrate transporter [Marasmius fiardii PR-910]|nr:MFS general substrate transporter [Marasmius fiardii PR-910]
MTNERTRLLLESRADRRANESLSTSDGSEVHNIIYERFSKREKAVVVVLVSYIGLIPYFVSGSFFPAIQSIAKDLNTSTEAVKQVINVGIFALAAGSFVGASLSSFYGRRPVYLWSLPLLIAGSVGVAMSRTIEELMVWRFLQTIGVSCVPIVGSAVVGDMYRLEERGTAMGSFLAACLLGPALAPVVGGFVAHYSSWRVMQASIGVAGVVGFAFVMLSLSETSLPGTRGVDKCRGRDDIPFTIPNPFAALSLLRSPNIIVISVIGWIILMTYYVILLPLPYTIAKRYGIENQATIGLLYAPAGVGNFVGAFFGGWLSDQVLKRMLKKRGGVWCPEDRLRAALWGAAAFVPLSILGVGIITEYVPGRLGLALNVICFFLNGFGVKMVLSPSASYAVDIMHARSAESVAAYRGLRSILISVGISAIAPAIERYGVLRTDAICTLIVWVGFGLLWILIKHGERMRNWVDVEYSTAETN